MTGMRTAGARGTVGPVRAREPDRSGFAVRDGVRLYYEVHGDGPTTVVLLPAWSIVHSRAWKLQVPYLARHFRVVVYDPRGNGRSDRPVIPSAYDDGGLVADALAVLDTVGVGLRGRGRAVAGRPDPAAAWPPTTRTGWLVRCSSRRRSSCTTREPVESHLRRAACGVRRVGQVERALLARRPAWVRGVLLRRGVPRGALDPASRGGGRVGSRDRRGRRSSPPSPRRAGC